MSKKGGALNLVINKTSASIKTSKAFTIVELTIVIVVIAILTAITIVGYNAVYTNAQITGVVSGLTKLNDSMRLWVSMEHNGNWPKDPVGGGGTSIQTLIDTDAGFKKFVDNVPEVRGVQTEDWFYDNEGDTKTNCTNPYNGVNIVIRFVDNAKVAQGVDDAIDDGNLNCGRVRYVDKRIFFTLGNKQKLDQQ